MNRDKPHYIMLPRKAVLAAVTIFVCLLVGIITSFQYANYVDRKSNQRWCELVSLFNISYKEIPPATELGQKIANAMADIEEDFRCQKKPF